MNITANMSYIEKDEEVNSKSPVDEVQLDFHNIMFLIRVGGYAFIIYKHAKLMQTCLKYSKISLQRTSIQQ